MHLKNLTNFRLFMQYLNNVHISGSTSLRFGLELEEFGLESRAVEELRISLQKYAKMLYLY